MMNIAQSGFTVNFPYTFDLQAQHIAWIIHRSLEEGWKELEVTAEAEAAWVDEIVERGGQQSGFSEACTPGYYNNEGKPELADDQLGRLGYPEGPVAYFAYIDQWRTSGEFAGLEFR